MYDFCAANDEIIHYIQGMLEACISGTHIQVNQLHLNWCGVLFLLCIDVGSYPEGFVCTDLLSGIIGRVANPVNNHGTTIDFY